MFDDLKLSDWLTFWGALGGAGAGAAFGSFGAFLVARWTLARTEARASERAIRFWHDLLTATVAGLDISIAIERVAGLPENVEIEELFAGALRTSDAVAELSSYLDGADLMLLPPEAALAMLHLRRLLNSHRERFVMASRDARDWNDRLGETAQPDIPLHVMVELRDALISTRHRLAMAK